MCWQICALYHFTETTHRFTIVLWVLWDSEPALHKLSANGKAKTPLQSSPLWSPPQANLSRRDLPALGTAHCQPCLHCSTHQHCWIRQGSCNPASTSGLTYDCSIGINPQKFSECRVSLKSTLCCLALSTVCFDAVQLSPAIVSEAVATLCSTCQENQSEIKPACWSEFVYRCSALLLRNC